MKVPGRGDHDASFGTLAGEFKDLVVAYTKQETLDPLKLIVRFVIWGVLGALMLGLGVGLLTLAILRVLQGELGDHLSGSLSWVPYAGGLLFAVTVAGLAISRIGKGPR
jgi:hypothetical protein